MMAGDGQVMEKEPLPARQAGPRAAHAPVRQGQGPAGAQAATSGTRTTRGRSAGDVIRTALCIEPRDGMLNVFMPPVSLLE